MQLVFILRKFSLAVKNRPVLNYLNARLIYPKYLSLSTENVNNVGNLILPEGTIIEFSAQSSYADTTTLFFDTLEITSKSNPNNQMHFWRSPVLHKSVDYSLELINPFSKKHK